MDDLAVARRAADDAGSPLFVDRPLHRLVDAAQPLGRDADRFGRRNSEIAEPVAAETVRSSARLAAAATASSAAITNPLIFFFVTSSLRGCIGLSSVACPASFGVRRASFERRTKGRSARTTNDSG